jgi:sporulation protein YlmC with PRC-barrel domain
MEIPMNDETRGTDGTHKVKTQGGSGPGVRQGSGPKLSGANLFVGNAVHNQKAEDMGYIKEVMLDAGTGRVGYAVLSFDGFFGEEEQLYAVPRDALTIDTENQRIVLDVEKNCLDNAPRFDPSRWPNMADPSWERAIHAFYGTTP